MRPCRKFKKSFHKPTFWRIQLTIVTSYKAKRGKIAGESYRSKFSKHRFYDVIA